MCGRLRTGGVVLLCFLSGVLLPTRPAAASQQRAPIADEEPPPTEVEPPPTEFEPPPAPLREDGSKQQLLHQKSALDRKMKIYGAIGYVGVALTAGLVVSGVTLGLLTQSRSDELGRLTVQSESGLAPIYDATQRDNYERLQLEGQNFQRATIGCLVAAGVTALGSGILFWQQSRAESAQKKLSWIPVPTVNQHQAALAVVGRW